MKIGVVGRCTATALGFSLMRLLDEDTVYAFEAGVWQREGMLDQVVALMKACDIVFMHKLPDAFGELEWSQFQTIHAAAHAIPPIVFTGVHPDCVYIRGSSDAFLGSPVGPYSSAIAAAVYSLGGDAETATRLFNADVFERLGYFAEFEKARRFLFKTFAEVGLDAAPEWEGWMHEGPFMHTINHPLPVILASVAKQLATKAALSPPMRRGRCRLSIRLPPASYGRFIRKSAPRWECAAIICSRKWARPSTSRTVEDRSCV
ncbi:MAG: WcbI family polysaccharide biosynthesis putative acetyltransferase [Methylocystis sp.]|uniref:WcbI family polysaccharide biosynthesis putative acetyltransferase n=1 Tax=Methylocystis sp. TaxID=1911079 RepID=UPI00393884F7